MIDPKNLSATATLVFSDEFDTLDFGKWETKYAFSPDAGATLPGNSEQEIYIHHSYAPTSHIKPWSVNNSILTLKAERATEPLYVTPDIGPQPFTSGMIASYPSFNPTYGYFEMRAKLPRGQGYWPAFWMLPSAIVWPPEIDIMEVLGHDMVGLWTTVHSTTTTPVANGIRTAVPDMSLAFHNFGLDWQADFIRWFFDGVEVFKKPTPADLHQPMYLIADLAVGGSWGGFVDATTPFPGLMQIDYIRAYKEGAVVPPAPPPTTTRPPRQPRRPRPRRGV